MLVHSCKIQSFYLLAAGLIAVPLSIAIAQPDHSDGESTTKNVKDEIIEEIVRKEINKKGDGEAVEHKTLIIRKITKNANGTENGTVEKEHKIIIHGDGKMSEEEREALKEKLEERLGDLDVNPKDGDQHERVAVFKLDDGSGPTQIKIKCSGEWADTWQSDDGRQVRLCSNDVESSGLEGLKAARALIAEDKELEDKIRTEVLSTLDAEIAAAGKPAQ